MIYAILSSLTIGAICYIIYKGKGKKVFKDINYTQSSIHEMIKDFLPRHLFVKPKKMSQSQQHSEKTTVKVIFMDSKAYWVINNTFFSASAVDGFVDTDSVEPVNTENMTKKDIDKMLFILDNLKNGRSDDSSNTGKQSL